ncbi:gp143 [Bacillus phage W.Ph.]|uniref:Gp143 n=1 Tax=Bacillus phage W.Ph. TaxID=764595 RepID=G9B1P4_9CAUD|nr:gp143 [Bacillus phage W.Ph.]ADH03289.1 gp143 [Bacillus phage W.Ph.]
MKGLDIIEYELESMKAKNRRRKSMLENQTGGESTVEYLSRVSKNYAITEVAIYQYELAISLLKGAHNKLNGGVN